jgi:preprotein translocase subunit SecB
MTEPITDAAAPATFRIEKLYVKDLSLEVPGGPETFTQPDSPQLDVQMSTEARQFGEALFEVTINVTVTARAGEKTVFLAEVAQAGIFAVSGIPQPDLEPLLGIGCPTILYPYAREAVSDLVARGGFPPVLLAPVSFEQLYLERQRRNG